MESTTSMTTPPEDVENLIKVCHTDITLYSCITIQHAVDGCG